MWQSGSELCSLGILSCGAQSTLSLNIFSLNLSERTFVHTSFLNSWELRSGKQCFVLDPELNLGMEKLSSTGFWVRLCPLDPLLAKKPWFLVKISNEFKAAGNDRTIIVRVSWVGTTKIFTSAQTLQWFHFLFYPAHCPGARYYFFSVLSGQNKAK